MGANRSVGRGEATAKPRIRPVQGRQKVANSGRRRHFDRVTEPPGGSEIVRQVNPDHAVARATVTEWMRGRWSATISQCSPSSVEANKLPEVVPK